MLWRHLWVTFSYYNLRDEPFREIDVRMSRRFQADLEGGSSFDLDADQLGVAADVKVVVLDVSQPVGEVQHGAVRKLDVELFHVEVDVALKGDIRL